MANVGESGESVQHGLANVSESGESDTFPKKAILASAQIRQKWHISGEYSNSPKIANFRRVLVFNKFAVEWPLLSFNKRLLYSLISFT